jgi:SAM-dependent methyltransferase
LEKSSTDLHWNERAASVKDEIDVNIMDVFQRELEYYYICRYLTKEMTVLEVGCGNGYSTNRFRELVNHIDAVDFSENMIERARTKFGETNNRFIHENILAPQRLKGQYDCVICVRVLINLQDVSQQQIAIGNFASLLKPGGQLILAEGFAEGFSALSELRGHVGLPPLQPAKINIRSSLNEVMSEVGRHFDIEDQFHLGAYDYLTRVLYPTVVGAENVKHNTVFSEKCFELAREFNPDCFEPLSRMRGFLLRRKA